MPRVRTLSQVGVPETQETDGLDDDNAVFLTSVVIEALSTRILFSLTVLEYEKERANYLSTRKHRHLHLLMGLKPSLVHHLLLDVL